MHKQYPRYRMGTNPFMYSIHMAPKMSLEKTINKSVHSIHNLTIILRYKNKGKPGVFIHLNNIPTTDQSCKEL
jgi:hypothetical protein